MLECYRSHFVLALAALAGFCLSGCFAESPCPAGTYLQRGGCVVMVDTGRVSRLNDLSIGPPVDGSTSERGQFRCPHRPTPASLVGSYSLDNTILSSSCSFMSLNPGDKDLGDMTISLDGDALRVEIKNAMVVSDGPGSIQPGNDVKAILKGSLTQIAFVNVATICFADANHGTVVHDITFEIFGSLLCDTRVAGNVARK